ncbi:hypothetical protein NM688_g580 [Phlebia brevispora]|uniref:Uncharacterized protein n=1 Tax=Phlebia brevispora TaxID=194682 RepID=A0ACC1TDQ7_9APHY|nr:hypothetical protein NM688_g580 [Phlebia brevispora]
MGQRHQAFLVARVVPRGGTEAEYRCIAAFHNQWCYGTLPLRAARRCLTLVQQKENAEIIREELHSIDGKYSHGRRSDIPAMSCPFTASLLGMSYAVNLCTSHGPYMACGALKYGVLEASMGSWDGDNDDGITVIDVTDPENPTYCFLFYDCRLLNAREYISNYYEIPTPKEGETLEPFEQSKVDSVAALEDERLLDPYVLVEAWPWEYSLNSSNESEDPTDATAESIPGLRIPTLMDLSLRSAVTSGLDSGDTKRIEDMLWLPGKADIVRDILYSQSPFPDTGVPLLTKLAEYQLSGAMSLDLSGLELSDTQVVQVASSFSGLSSLNLSRNPRITATVVEGLVSNLPRLKRLVLMNCPSVQNEDINALISSQPKLFFKLEALMHPAFLTPDNAALWTPNFTAFTVHEVYQGVSLPLFTPSGIMRGLADFLEAALECDPYEIDNSGGFGIAAALTAAYRDDGKLWSERSVVAIPGLQFRQVAFDGTTPWMFLFALSRDEYPRDSEPKGWARAPNKRKNGRSDVEHTKEDSSKVEAERAKVEGSEGKPAHQADKPKPSMNVEVHDVRGFVRLTQEEGRPSVPEELVVRVEELFKKVAETCGQQGRVNNSGLLSPEGALRRLEAVRDQQELVRSYQDH